MTTTPRNQPHIPQLQIDTDKILSRITFAQQHTCNQCQVPVTILIIDIKRLLAEVTRLHSALIAERMISANLRAAIGAALGAESDGEPDPLAYLREEFPDTRDTDAAGEWRWS